MIRYQILLLLDLRSERLSCRSDCSSLRLAPSAPHRRDILLSPGLSGVAVTSQILCISITLNKG